VNPEVSGVKFASHMTIQELKFTFLNDLVTLYPKEEIQSFFNLLVSYKLKLTRVDIVLNPNQIIRKNDLDFFQNALTELQQEKPIQYILGETEFYGLPFKVDKNVLIPRAETEELVEWILEDVKHKTQDVRQLQILDIGTGSGCIAISIAKNSPNAIVSALDISKQAVQLAQQNAKLNHVNIHFIEEDILQINRHSVPKLREYSESQKYDIIVSNPPYVRELEKHEIKKNVLDYEPQLALFVTDENPLLFYDKIADFAKEHLTKNGQLYFEINQYLGKEMVALLTQKGFAEIELKKDILGNDRMLRGLFNHQQSSGNNLS